MTGRHIIVAALATLAAISARADWNIGVVGNRVKVEGDAIQGAAGYQQVAYIETDINSWLNTGVDSSDDLEVQTRIKPLEFTQAYTAVFGAYYGESHNTFRMIQQDSNLGWYIYPNTKANAGGTGVTKYRVPYGVWTSFMLKQWQYAYGATTNNISIQTKGTTYNGPMLIGQVKMKCRYAYFRMLTNSIVVFDGIPVIAPSGQGALYDTISKRLLENLGAGTITYGLTED